MKVVRNVILNIDLRDQPFMMHHSPLRSRQKISRIENFKDLTYLTDISDLVMGCFFVKMKVVKNGILNNLYLNDKLPILHCSPSGSLTSLPNSQIL